MGHIGAPYGIKGWCSLISYTAPKENLLNYSPWYLEQNGQWQAVEPEQVRPHGKKLITKLPGCDNRDQAATLTHSKIAIERTQLPELNEGDYYWSDLEGLTVKNIAGETLGIIDSLMETGANDVIVVKNNGETLLIPYIKETVVKSIDLKNKFMVVEWEIET